MNFKKILEIRGQAYVRKHEQELRKEYGENTYIAVFGWEGVRDFDRDKMQLRIRHRHGGGLVIGTIDDILNKILVPVES